MSASNIDQALENIYTSLHSNNENLDACIAQLKDAIAPARDIEIDAARLPFPNREGRKTMQTYFKKRGISVLFAKAEQPK